MCVRAGPRGRVAAGRGSSAACRAPVCGPSARPRPGAGESSALGGQPGERTCLGSSKVCEGNGACGVRSGAAPLALERMALICSEQQAVRWYGLLPAGGTCVAIAGGAKQGQWGYC